MAGSDLYRDGTYKVSNNGGAVRLTTSSNVAVATAVDSSVREIIIQATSGNASAVVVNIYETASATLGIVIPAAVTTVDFVGANSLRLSVSSLTAISIYAAEDGDEADVMWRN